MCSSDLLAAGYMRAMARARGLTDSLSVYFNGEKIELLAFPGSHDDNEVIVHFTGSKVVHLSSVVNGFNFPSIDSDGDALMFEKLVGKAIDLLPEDAVIVSGHNEPGSWSELQAYRDMLAKVRDRVAKLKAEGKTGAEIVAAKPTADLDEKWGGGFMKPDVWVGLVYESMK